MRDYDAEEEIRRQLRARRREALRREKERQERLRRRILLGICALGLVLLLTAGGALLRHLLSPKSGEETTAERVTAEETDLTSGVMSSLAQPVLENKASDLLALEGKTGETADNETASGETDVNQATAGVYQVEMTEATQYLESENVMSSYALLVDVDEGTVVAHRGASTRICPASMTKILTVLVAAEQLNSEASLDDRFTITIDITDYSYSHDCSAVGFAENEVVTVRDLFYGTILPSGADAALALAIYTAGSQEAFVDLMNARLEELGLADTAHFTNCVGLYDENHYCTLYDMALILKAAIDNEFCREVLSAHTYTTSATTEHPEGIIISNWFLRRIEDKETNGEVVCAKTGFVNESGSCAASYSISNSGKQYICVTANAWSSWRCIYDHVAIYQEYT